MRANVGGCLGSTVPDALRLAPPALAGSAAPAAAPSPVISAVIRNDSFAVTGGGSAATASVDARKKPAWARSETAQATVDTEDADQLVNFAAGLDFDKCVLMADECIGGLVR